MSDTRYPTRMHEVLGVETGERFKIEKLPDEFFLNHEGRMTVVTAGRMFNSSGDILTYAINNGIIRKPRMSEEQVKQLGALVTLGYRWLIKDSTDAVFAYNTRPAKQSEWWNCGGANVRIFIDLPPGILTSLVSWSDPEPLDIVATLKAAGVEVEE